MKRNPYNISLNPTHGPRLASRSNAGYGERGVDLNAAARPKPKRKRKKR